MAFLSDKITDIGLPAELALFTVPPNQVAVDKILIYFKECRPVSSFDTEYAAIEITVPGQGSNEYIDLRRSRLYVKCKIVKSDGSALAAHEKTGHHQFTSTNHVVANRHLYERKTRLPQYQFICLESLPKTPSLQRRRCLTVSAIIAALLYRR